MKTFVRQFFVPALVALAVLPMAMRAGDSDPLPIESAIIKKKLPNGLTYYIRANKRPENRAQLHLVVNAGSILETEKTQGLAHFLEHMAFNGTKNFEKLEIVNFLERTGMQFGADLNAYTSFDETAYRLEVPMDKPEVVKKAFAVLEDWAHNITFDAEEIDKERGVVTEEWRTGRGAGGRLRDKQIPVLFHESLYAKRLPIGETDDIATVKRQDFLDFYTKWYRPDLMAVIAVGDFDVKQIEAMIVEHFGKLKNPPNAPERPKPQVPDHEGTLFSIETDPELSSTSIQIACKHPLAPDGTASDYRRDLVEGLYSQMLNQRMGERVLEANPPYLFAGVGKSHMVRVKDMASLRAGVKEGQWTEGLKALLLETRRARRDGFTTNELERAKLTTLRSYERSYEERDKTESGSYAREYVGNFLENEPIPGIEEELKMARRFLTEISLSEVNRAGDRWITETNRVILFSAPDKPGLKKPTREEILAVIKEADAAEIAAYSDGAFEAPLLANAPKPGTIVSEKEHKEIETTEWVLSNGIRVLLKPTTFKNDQILMSAFSPGGHSLVADRDYLSASMAQSILAQSGWGPYDAIQLRKKMAGKIASVGSGIDELYETMSGTASPKDLETWFQLMHLHFVAPRADEKSFQSYKARLKEGIENRQRSPAAVFGDAVEKALYGDHLRHRPMTVEMLKELDRETALKIYRERFANAGDFTFVFVGAFKTGDLKPLVQTYLASLPASERKEKGKHVGDDPKRGKLSVEVKKGIEPKSSVRLVFHGDAKWSMDERHALRSAVDVLRIRLREVLREDKGGVYGVGVFGDLSREPKETFSTGISFSCNPTSVPDLIQAALEEVKRLQTEGPSTDNLEKVRETQLRNFERNLKENNFWLSNIYFYRENELPFDGILKVPERAKALTAEKVRDAARKYFSSENMMDARLLPEAATQSASSQQTPAPIGQ
jgi:zinc protease